jgi:hypothetical protein
MAGRARRGSWVAVIAVALVGAACGSSNGGGAKSTTTTAPGSATRSPSTTVAQAQVLAPAGDQALSAPVDGIKCDSTEQLLFHIHAYLGVYVNGVQELLAPGIGIGPPLQFEQTQTGPSVTGGSCFSWLHTHDSSGVIHIESPVQQVFTLGEFFDIWGQSLSASQVGPAHGAVTATVNGLPFSGDPRSIPLNARNVIQLDVGSTSPPPQPYTFAQGL